jgi:zinc transport system substrate-binding protein
LFIKKEIFMTTLLDRVQWLFRKFVLPGLLIAAGGACAVETVFVSIAPQEYFVERIGGERVNVQALVKPGSSPATYSPSPKQVVELGKASLYFRIGVPFEMAFLPKISGAYPDLKVVDTSEGIDLRTMETSPHDHEGDSHHHEAGAKDPHIWLNPRLVKVQARTIAAALIQADPAGKAVYEANLAGFLADLDVLDAHLTDALAPLCGKTFMVFHPAWGYFADAYGLKQVSVEVEGKDPSAQQLTRIVERARTDRVQAIFVQPQFSTASARAIADAIGGVVVPIDPLARSYIENLEAAASQISAALKKQK